MIQVRLLGSFDVRDASGRPIVAVLQQPKRAALLAYLAASPAGTFHRRDRIVALFWPEADEAHARNALSAALRFLRKALGEGTIVGRGTEEIGLDPQLVSSDVAAFLAALEMGDRRAAVEGYGGDLLWSFHISGAPGFEEWVEEERARLRARASGAAAQLADALTSSDHQALIHWARLASTHAPDDEAAVRRLLVILDAAGDRAGALRAYDAFAERLRADYDAEPAPETRAVIAGVRARLGAGSSADRQAGRQLASSKVTEATLELPAPGQAPRSPLVRLVWGSVAGTALLAIVVLAGFGRDESELRPPPYVPSVAVRAFANATGDSAWSAIGEALARGIVSQLTTLGGVQVIGGIDARTTADYLVSGSYHRVGDSLEFVTEILDLARDRALAAPEPVRAPLQDPMARIDGIRSRAMGALAYYTGAFGGSANPQRRPPSYEAYLAFQEGVVAMGRMEVPASEMAFRRALKLDPTYTEAYSLLGSVAFMNQPGPGRARGTGVGRFDAIDSLADAMHRQIPSLTEADRHVIDALRSLAQGNLSGALEARQRLTAHFPSAPFGVGRKALWLNRPRLAIEAFAELSPHKGWVRDDAFYWFFIASAHHQLGDYKEELRAARAGRALFPSHPLPRQAEARALLAQGELTSFRELAVDMPVNFKLRLALELRAHSHEEEAVHLLHDVRARADSMFPGQRPLWTAMTLLALGNLEEVTPMLEKLVAEDSLRLDYKGLLGTAYARQGRRADALRLSDEVGAVSEPYLGGLQPLWQARIAARLGDRDRATELLGLAFSQGVMHEPQFPQIRRTWWHSDPDFESLGNYKPFRELVRSRE